MSSVGFFSSPRFIEHTTSPQHPERSDRICAIHRAVRVAGMIESPDPFPDFKLDFGKIDGRGVQLLELTPTPADAKWVLEVHSEKYVHRIQQICAHGGGLLDQGDTPVGAKSYEIALLSVGSLLTCCDAVMSGKAKRAFSAARPPGHHAEPDRPMGFCMFSNIAIAARYLQRKHGVEKIAIVDFDVHHGNGTQAVFEADPSVLFVSLHQDPRTCYPGTGYAHETGTGRGEGFTLNIPMAPKSSDDDYRRAFDTKVIPKLNEFKPQMLLVSAGFDAHRDDPLAEVNLSEDCFEQMTRMLVDVANTHCAGRVVSTLEGGYDLRALGRSLVRHLVGLGTG
jgi:acetoin utilization deacetylase AcuC-like enzyme